MYAGMYNGSKKHEPDLQQVLGRSWEAGLNKIIITGGSLEESEKALELAKTDDRLYATVGCHPTRCNEFEQSGQDPNNYLEKLINVVLGGKDKIVAIGECGLDYDRTQFCPKNIQKKYFEYQLELSKTLQFPLFLHCRNAADDLYNILVKFSGLKGVVHSFDGTIDEARRFIDLGYYIGLNGCSLKTQENLECVKNLPSDKILIETDCPWCEIRPSHAGSRFITKENQSLPSTKKEKWLPNHTVKSRNEPINIRQVLDVLSAVKNEDPDKLCETIYQNSLALFFPSER
ncbi:putative deoxyribonuclease TATDN1 isoform X2 [Anoplophora glabripennis]|nr:putative deoxyribonuclease TATDN1 isoform X2 [Anoplophora glabripennis]